MSSLKEADIVRAILRYLKTVPNCFCWKEHGGMYGTAGIPDVIACIGGRFFALEVKTEKRESNCFAGIDSSQNTKMRRKRCHRPFCGGGKRMLEEITRMTAKEYMKQAQRL